tara:strand:+ start:941 stop:1240 length:300 start_codon:yes stop_codon:yes gene_type:complete
MIIVSNDKPAGDPNVPNAESTAKWKSYLWRRNTTGSDVNLYLWDDTAASDATYLKWRKIGNFIQFDQLSNYTDDTAAATGGVMLGAMYHTAGTLKIRIA